MRLYKNFLSLAILGFLSLLLLNQCKFKCKEFAAIPIDVSLFDANTHQLLSVDNHKLVVRMATETQSAVELSINKNNTSYTVTVPVELFVSDKVYQGEILVDNQWRTTIWIQLSREGRGCPNPAHIAELNRSSRSATTVLVDGRWLISIAI